MLEEKVIYERGNVKITNLSAIFGYKTYAISSITSVTQKEKTNLLAFWPLATMVFGIALIILAFFKDFINWAMVIFGIFVAVGGYFVALLNHTEYFVQIGGTFGEEQAFKSMYIGEVTEIVQAINQAVIQEG